MNSTALEIKNLTKIYSNQLKAVEGISFEIAKGDFFGLLGPNGAGKSTTIGIISSLVNKTSGQVKVFGHDLDQSPHDVKKMIGMVPQEFNFNIFETVEQILMNQAGFYGLPKALAKESCEFYIAKLGLFEKRKEIASRLSGGMKRRLLIARALVHEPLLLILDEPTAGVDIELRRSIWLFLKEINAKGTTIILTTHYLEEAESLCRNIAIINQGHIIEHSSTKKLLAKIKLETFIFYLNKSLTEAPLLKNFTCHLTDETTLEVEISQQQSLSALFEEFSRNQIEVLSMRNKINRLEELFLKLLKKDDTYET